MISNVSISAQHFFSKYSAPSSVERALSRNDRDGDGQISFGEFGGSGQNLPTAAANSSSLATSGGKQGAQFDQIDSDGDGYLSASELKTFQRAQIAAANTALLNLQNVLGSDAGLAEAPEIEPAESTGADSDNVLGYDLSTLPPAERDAGRAELQRLQADMAEAQAAMAEARAAR